MFLVFKSNGQANEVYICVGDLNLNCLQNKWLNRSYHPLQLTKIVQTACHDWFFNQLFNLHTSFEHNSVSGKTSYSFRDHVFVYKL